MSYEDAWTRWHRYQDARADAFVNQCVGAIAATVGCLFGVLSRLVERGSASWWLLVLSAGTGIGAAIVLTIRTLVLLGRARKLPE